MARKQIGDIGVGSWLIMQTRVWSATGSVTSRQQTSQRNVRARG